jgi:hypothetical protein
LPCEIGPAAGAVVGNKIYITGRDIDHVLLYKYRSLRYYKVYTLQDKKKGNIVFCHNYLIPLKNQELIILYGSACNSFNTLTGADFVGYDGKEFSFCPSIVVEVGGKFWFTDNLGYVYVFDPDALETTVCSVRFK